MDNYILEIPNIVPKVLCDKLVEGFNNSSEKCEDGYMEYFGKKRSKYNKQLSISGLDAWKELDSTLMNYIQFAFDKYIQNLKEKFDFKGEYHTLDRILYGLKDVRDTGLLLQKIKRGDKFEWHHDGMPGDSWFLQAIVYLNTLEPSEGGSTEFINGRKVQPEVGKIVLFPSSWLFPHKGNEVKCDAKYICTTVMLANFEY